MYDLLVFPNLGLRPKIGAYAAKKNRFVKILQLIISANSWPTLANEYLKMVNNMILQLIYNIIGNVRSSVVAGLWQDKKPPTHFKQPCFLEILASQILESSETMCSDILKMCNAGV